MTARSPRRADRLDFRQSLAYKYVLKALISVSTVHPADSYAMHIQATVANRQW